MIMTRAELKEYYKQQNLRRFISDVLFGYSPKEVHELRRELKQHPTSVIEMKCFNDVDAEVIKESLTPEEQKRVHFSYLFRIPEEEVLQ